MNRIISLDMEFNTQPGIEEIISVGAVVMNNKFNIIDEYESYIKMTLTDKMDPYSQQVHKISKNTLDNAREFREVFTELIETLNLKTGDLIITWGPNDKKNIETNSKRHGLKKETKILTKHIKDIQPVIHEKIIYKGEKPVNQISLDNIRLMCGIKVEPTHNALDDARCLAKVYEYYMTHDIIENDEMLEFLLAHKPKKIRNPNRKRRKKKDFSKELEKLVKEFETNHPDGVVVDELSSKLIKKMVFILNKSKIKNFKNYSSDFYELKTKDGYLIKNGRFVEGLTCKIYIKKNQLRFEFRMNDRKYYCYYTADINARIQQITSFVKRLEKYLREKEGEE